MGYYQEVMMPRRRLNDQARIVEWFLQADLPDAQELLARVRGIVEGRIGWPPLLQGPKATPARSGKRSPKPDSQPVPAVLGQHSGPGVS